MLKMTRPIIILSFLLSIKAGPSAAQPISAYGGESSGGLQNILGLGLDFTSAGEGIDSDTHKKILVILGESLEQNEITKFLVQRYGRNGERKICVEFKSLDLLKNVGMEIKQVIDRDPERLTTIKGPLNCRDFIDFSLL